MVDKLVLDGDSSALVLDTGQLVKDWLDFERKANNASANTVSTYERSFGIFQRWLEAESLAVATVAPMNIYDFKESQAKDYSPQTVNLQLVAIRSFYRWAVTSGRAAYNPASEVKGVKRIKSQTHKRDALSSSEVANVLSQPITNTLAGLRDKAILVLFAYCALRSVEVHRANIGDIKTRGDRLTLDVQGKGHTEADAFVIIPLSQEPVIREWLRHRVTFKDSSPDAPLFLSLSNRTRGQRLALRSIRGMAKRYYQAADVVGNTKTTHSLRHSAITSAIRQGASPLQVQSMARHKSFDTTLGYFHEVSRLDSPAEDYISYE